MARKKLVPAQITPVFLFFFAVMTPRGLTPAQKKNKWRDRRREAIRNGAPRSPHASNMNEPTCNVVPPVSSVALRSWALSVIQYYTRLWEYAKSTPLMTRHKKRRLTDKFALAPYGGVITEWAKADGYVYYSIRGCLRPTLHANGHLVTTSPVVYDYYDESYGKDSRFVETRSGSFYSLLHHINEDHVDLSSIEREKRSDLIKFRILYGVPALRPSS